MEKPPPAPACAEQIDALLAAECQAAALTRPRSAHTYLDELITGTGTALNHVTP
ncbi:hypothetical protein [Streptomyces aureoversilis]|uniref:Uncharacterized protein n=1 Tax=Streptomyces aureoversilis TaxID=67277 RepID=A0ABV9ZUK2_9ACTN